ncbi:MAG: pyruvate kinase [Candidatus Ryanbacteria bacterium RIFCSPHIGHO2_02_FULL_45_13b]|uniref:Pyruvate kinase n=1 Tax=Candidatus Ryanbacteria bacterium RIFCSPHIGHO2_02_FULL_45_13b TaxID=1802117 RepID=A0A1G2G9P8_9BACT|nr:MAG: pyruvate kinase [Candidatus Ryanbacteria bacterium RIFCSPHIGHO2_02_FULL_45_13b]
MNLERKTKIVATIGPASEARDMLLSLFQEGVDVTRLNFSHDVHERHLARIKLIRELSEKVGKHIAIIGDLQGPKMRIGDLPEEGILLKDGEEVQLDASISKYAGGAIPVPSRIFAEGALKGTTVFLDDGTMMLEIRSVKGSIFKVRVLRGGVLLPHKGINLPQIHVRSDIFDQKDKRDMEFAVKAGVDYLALSFLRTGDDVRTAKKLLKGAPVKLVAKIERHEALQHLDDIIAETDAVMVARGDLGIETPVEELPVRQKEIIAAARSAMKPVIVATQMLGSMTKNLIPTRAEVSDVANAVFDSADAVMLSAESASGRFPAESVRTMRKVIENAEAYIKEPRKEMEPDMSLSNIAVAKSAKFISQNIGAKAILVGTVTGFSASAVSHFRPETPVFALTVNTEVARLLGLTWGVNAFPLEGMRSVEEISTQGITVLKKLKKIKKGDRVVFVSGAKVGEAGKANNLTVISVL